MAYFAAYDVHRAQVLGRIAPKTGIEPFTDLVAQVMTTEPYASAKRVFWVVDNGSSHRGSKAIDRLTTQFPNAVMVHTPVHASWLNQVEIYFSILQRKAISPADFTDLDHLAWPSKSATTPPRNPSTGPTPETTSTTSYDDSENAITRTITTPRHDPPTNLRACPLVPG